MTRSPKETWAAPSTKEISAVTVILTPGASRFTKRTIPTNEKKWKIIHAQTRHGGGLAVSVSKMVTTMLRLTAFGHEGGRDFDDGFWLRLIHDGSTKKRLEFCQDKDENLCYFRAIQEHSGGTPICPELMKYTPFPCTWKEYIYHRGSAWIFQSILGSGVILRGKEKDNLAKQYF